MILNYHEYPYKIYIMKKENISPKIITNLDTKSDQYKKNKDMMLEKLSF